MVEKRKRQLIIDNVPSFVKSKSFASFIKEHGVEAECEKADNMTFCTLYFSVCSINGRTGASLVHFNHESDADLLG